MIIYLLISYQQEQQSTENFDNKEKILGMLFLCGFTFMFLVFYFFPELSPEKLIRFPRGADDLRLINSVIQKLTQNHFYHVTLAFCSLYVLQVYIYLACLIHSFISLQTFAIPGPIFLSVLSGAIFGGVPGFLMVCLCATSGASLCYTLSWLLGRNLVKRFFNQRLIQMQAQLEKQKDNLIFYLLFLRITPIVPNFFINISSPILNVPLSKFFIATLFGLMPMNIIHVKTGMMLNDIQQVGADFKDSFPYYPLSSRKSQKKNMLDFKGKVKTFKQKFSQSQSYQLYFNQFQIIIIKNQMSVRPITYGEDTKATGHPFVNIGAVFGGLQGLLYFLHVQRIPFRSNWFAQPRSFAAFAILAGGGYLAGGIGALLFFTDRELLRLKISHNRDELNMIESQLTPLK
ncbi:UNKNOWN [Stylonychia lemnae]|uniref:VTT domain-containing protein n=1 Tax=Stylonychia lemnae TaxID=5949 RepID=A0A077ZXY8_STYLE|nr:UNKNOWN [Stylonychia lemnae]|eukprot:CDW74771.1 UNKNOWN [Stylonychia lemnae]